MAVTETLILGIGNPLLGDDGVGVEAAARLRERAEPALSAVEILDGGSVGLYLLPHLEGRSHVLVLDAIDFGGRPGEIVRLRADEIPSYIATKVSEHQVTFHEVLALMDLLEIKPREFLFLGVQPKSQNWGDSLSPEVAASMDEMLQKAVMQIQAWREDGDGADERPLRSA